MNLELDQDGHLVDYTVWNHDVAQQLALPLDITLNDWHYQVLEALRDFYSKFSHSPATRPLIKYLNKTVSNDINNILLQQEFNTGLVARELTRLAGIPKPPNCL